LESTLITGGAGFIGSHLAVSLAQASQRVVVVDNFNDYYDPAIKRANVLPLAYSPLATVIEADVRDADRMNTIVAQYDVTRIVHLAAMANVRASVEQGPLYVAVNTLGTTHILDAARRNDVKLVVCASTSSVYGQDTPVPFCEEAAADHPLAPYPASKRAAELIAHAYHNLFGLDVTVLRFFNVYGPNGRPDMMPLRVLEALIHRQTITLFDGGRMQRDWTYIEDTVAGIRAALDRPLGFEIINLGCGEPQPMTEFIDIMEELTGQEAIVEDAPAPPSDPPITYCDNGKARRLLDFEPQTSLAEGLAHTWEWYRRKHGLTPG